ncbi:MAG: PQQ-binding-like beta-propeller repeat protein, partial [Planctomycetota bacterium]
MRMPRTLANLLTSIPFLVGLGANGPLLAADAPRWPRFHGPRGDNVSTETGLLKEWPEQGPKLLWTAQAIGQGFASVTIAEGLIYTAGDIDDSNVITAIDMDGRIQWQVQNGAAWTASGPKGARGTPTLDGDRLYHENAHEEVVCLDAKTGKQIWGLDLSAELQGQKG